MWDQPWLNSWSQTNISLSPDDEEIKNAANFALFRLYASDDNWKKRALAGVMDASAHVRFFGKLECV